MALANGARQELLISTAPGEEELGSVIREAIAE